LYIDDLKLLGRNENDLENEMKIVQTISKDINIKFGLEKCARIRVKRGSVQGKMHVLKEEIESKCRLCKQHEETIDHLTSGCPILAKNEYLMRNDKVCTHLHYSICKALGTETTDKWYTHIPKPVCEYGDVTLLWNQAVHTDREVAANMPDIIIKNKKEKTCTLIDVAIPADRNVV